MPKYYAVVFDDCVQKDAATGQLEIYETLAQAEAQRTVDQVVIPIKMKRQADLYNGPVSNTKPSYWEDEDYKPDEDDSFERSY